MQAPPCAPAHTGPLPGPPSPGALTGSLPELQRSVRNPGLHPGLQQGTAGAKAAWVKGWGSGQWWGGVAARPPRQSPVVPAGGSVREPPSQRCWPPGGGQAPRRRATAHTGARRGQAPWLLATGTGAADPRPGEEGLSVVCRGTQEPGAVLGGGGGDKEEAGQPGRPAQWTPRFVVQPAQGGGQDCGPSPPQGPPRPASPFRPGLPQTLPDGPCPRQRGLCFEWKRVWRGLGASSPPLLACEGHRCGPPPGLRRIRPATPDTLPLLAQSHP